MLHPESPVRGSAAPTPPMGWNSWDAYGTNVREDEILANAAAMAELLLPQGYDTVVVDHQWYDPLAAPGPYVGDWSALCIDAHGRLRPDPARFPSSANGAGFKPLADAVHALGLKFGLHLMRGVPRKAAAEHCPVEHSPHTCDEIADTASTCSWNNDMWGLQADHPGAQAYVDSVVRLFAAWGVDFIKADDMMNEPFHGAEISLLRRALDAVDRPMVLSLSPAAGFDTWMAGQLRREADMWRISGDLWDEWHTVRRMFDLCAVWCWQQTEGRWPDCDMLPLGRIGIRAQHGPDRQTRLTPDEQRTLMTLWCLFRSPLFMGGDLPSLREDPHTLSLLTDPFLLRMHREGRNPRPLLADGNRVVWHSEAPGGGRFLAAFNLSDSEKSFADLLPRHPEARAALSPHACRAWESA